MDTSIIIKCLQDLQSIDSSVREKAESTLTALQKEELYTEALMNILCSEIEVGIKLPAAIVLKECFKIGDKAVKATIVKAISLNYSTPAIWYI